MIRTKNERLRTNRNIVVQRDTTGLSNILFAIRSEEKADNTSVFEGQMGMKPTTQKLAIIRKYFSKKDPQLQIESEDFSEEADSTILVSERVKGTKLEGNYKSIKGKIAWTKRKHNNSAAKLRQTSDALKAGCGQNSARG